MDLELLHVTYCNFSEIARWAFDGKGITHRRRALLPVLHRRTIRRLTGQADAPALRCGDRWLVGSTSILEALEALAPEPPLFPATPAQRRAVATIVQRFDEDWGPRARRAVLSVLLNDPGYLADLYSAGRPAAERLSYRLFLTATHRTLRRLSGITGAGSIENAHAACREALSFVAETAGPSGYLVGDGFTAADLTAAALLAPLANPPGCEITRPQPQPDAAAVLQGQYADHPGVAWVLEIYRRHRAPAHAV